MSSTAYDDGNVFRVLRHLTSEDLRFGFVRLLRRRITIFYVRSDFGEDAWCFRTVFIRGAVYMGFDAAVRHHLAAGYGRGSVEAFLLCGLFCGMNYRKGRVRFVDGSFEDLGNYGIQVGRCQASAFFFRNLRYLQAEMIGLPNLSSFRYS